MRLGLAGFAVAAVGLGIAFAMGESYKPGNPLALLAFGTCVLGVALGFIAVPWGWYRILRSKSKK